MVNREVLDANPEWMRTRRVIRDDEPLASKKATKRKPSATGASAPSNPDLKNARRKLKHAKNALASNLAGNSFEKLRDDLEADGDDEDEDEDGDKRMRGSESSAEEG
jgi:hypothetical protein